MAPRRIMTVLRMMSWRSSRDSRLTSPVEPRISTAAVPCSSWSARLVRNPSKSTVPSRLNGVMTATKEPSTRSFAMIDVHLLWSIRVFGRRDCPAQPVDQRYDIKDGEPEATGKRCRKGGEIGAFKHQRGDLGMVLQEA